MNIYNNVLIAVDDSNQSKDALEQIFFQSKTSVIFSALGRLKSKNLIAEVGRGKNKTYEITTKGSDIVESRLENLRHVIADKKFQWLLISLSIPETYKVERERVRKFLKGHGFTAVRNGLFLGQVINRNEFIQELNEVKDRSIIVTFNIVDPPEVITNNLGDYWDPKALRNTYHAWINDVNAFLKHLPEANYAKRIMAKTLVFELALIVIQDPKVNNKEFNKSTGRQEAFDIYEEIRELCYSE